MKVQSNTQDYDVEAATNIPVKNNNFDCQVCCINFMVIFFCGIVVLPFGIANIYYAFTDKSCVNDNANLSLKYYLAVEGILLLTIYLIIIISLLLADKFCNIKLKFINAASVINNLFMIAWLIVGSVLFWHSINNKKCDKDVYNYIYASLVIKLTLTTLSVLKKICYSKNNVTSDL